MEGADTAVAIVTDDVAVLAVILALTLLPVVDDLVVARDLVPEAVLLDG